MLALKKRPAGGLETRPRIAICGQYRGKKRTADGAEGRIARISARKCRSRHLALKSLSGFLIRVRSKIDPNQSVVAPRCDGALVLVLDVHEGREVRFEEA